MTIQRFETGPRMGQIVVHGDTVYLAGIVADKTAGDSVTKQTQEVLSIDAGPTNGYPTAFAAARPALRPENRQPPRKVPSSER